MTRENATPHDDALHGKQLPCEQEYDKYHPVGNYSDAGVSHLNPTVPMYSFDTVLDDAIGDTLDTEPPVRKRGVLQSVAQRLLGSPVACRDAADGYSQTR
ncbi:hypothetical protein LSM04_008935 [Trypanosoma melophagium]|uniref:uncharacterized protein n=1 Tax=Trypanosoma melophagium TaxID=715481 RepID=UPI00351A0295|nr:hypothetical protein LSM04_008636 [Trypanosoma melophagium]KAH9601063.1 hypothetical protein LSM04_008935 [Trypanosoma melophagium]